MSATAFQFDEKEHRYSIDGELQPNVTWLLELYGFIDYGGVPEYTLNRKCELGSIVDAATCYMDRDSMAIDLAIGLAMADFEERTIEYDILAEEIQPYCEAHARFKAESGVVILPEFVKHRSIATVNGMRYGMEIDLACVLNKQHTILDRKCTYGKEQSWPVQLAAYSLGLPKPENVVRWERAVEWLKPDGKYEILPGGRKKSDRIQERRDEEAWLAVLRMAHWKRECLGHF